FVANITITDSYSQPEVGTQQYTIKVIPPNLQLTNSLPDKLLLNRPFSGKVLAIGGVPPYHFSLIGGPPPGLSTIDPDTGAISGTPNFVGSGLMSVQVMDSQTPPQVASHNYLIKEVTPLGRNDTVQTATAIGNGQIQANISPYIDPPDGTPEAYDQDYYKLMSLAGSVVHVATFAQQWNSGDP